MEYTLMGGNKRMTRRLDKQKKTKWHWKQVNKWKAQSKQTEEAWMEEKSSEYLRRTLIPDRVETHWNN